MSIVQDFHRGKKGLYSQNNWAYLPHKWRASLGETYAYDMAVFKNLSYTKIAWKVSFMKHYTSRYSSHINNISYAVLIQEFHAYVKACENQYMYQFIIICIMIFWGFVAIAWNFFRKKKIFSNWNQWFGGGKTRQAAVISIEHVNLC